MLGGSGSGSVPPEEGDATRAVEPAQGEDGAALPQLICAGFAWGPHPFLSVAHFQGVSYAWFCTKHLKKRPAQTRVFKLDAL